MKRLAAFMGLFPGARAVFIAIIFLAACIGAFLRLYLIGDQIILDDEWHAFYCATGYRLSYLIGHSFAGANSAPVNAYCRLLLDTVGWSEFWIRLPSLLFGIAALVWFPLLVRKTHGRMVAALFAIFLSGSPFLTFYSRVIRPYSALVFFLFTAVYAGMFWLTSRKRGYLLLYIAASVAAVYFQPVAVATVFIPLAAGTLCLILRRSGFRKAFIPDIRIGPGVIFLTGGAILVATLLILQSAVVTNALTERAVPLPETWRQFLLLLFGTSSRPLALTMLALCATGAAIIVRRDLLQGSVVLFLALAHTVLFGVIGAKGIYAAIVLARFMIVLFPVCFVCTAAGLQSVAAAVCRVFKAEHPSAGPAVTALLAAPLIAALLITSPLRDTYVAPNNFTNHSAFQESYEPALRGGSVRSYWSSVAPKPGVPPPLNLPRFYRDLPAGTGAIIEYPVMLGDNFNPFYLYQRRHGRRVIAGYSDLVDDTLPSRTTIYGNMVINHVLREVPDKSRIRFRNIVNVMDPQAVRASGAEFIILHRDPGAELSPDGTSAPVSQSVLFDGCAARLQRSLGLPFYEDRHIVAFHVAGPDGEN